MRIKLDQVGRALVGETWTEPATQGIGNVGGACNSRDRKT